MAEIQLSDYEVMFTPRMGITIMVDKQDAFNEAAGDGLSFEVAGKDLVIRANGDSVTLKGMNPDHLDEAQERGSFELYEMEDDEFVRSTPCTLGAYFLDIT